MINPMTSKERFSEFVKTSTPLIGSQLTLCIPVIISSVYIGSLGEAQSLAVFGMGMTYFYLLGLSLIISVNEVVGAECSKAFGARNYRRMAGYFKKGLVTLTGILGVYTILALYSATILTAVGIEKQLIEPCSRLIQLALPYQFFMALNLFIQTYLSAQGAVRYFNYLNIGSIILVSILGKLFILDWGYKEIGFVYFKFIQELFAFGFFVYLLLYQSNKETLARPSIHLITEDFTMFIKQIGYSIMGAYGEFLAFEINTYLVARLNSIDELAVFVCTINSTLFVFYASLGISNAFRTSIGNCIGEGKIEEARSKSIAYFGYTFVLSMIITIAIFLFERPLALLFMNNESLVPMIVLNYRIYYLNIFPSLIFYAFLTLFRILDEYAYFFRFVAIYLPLMVAGCSFTLGYIIGLREPGIWLGFILVKITLTIVFLVKLYVKIDWRKNVGDKRERLLSEVRELSSLSFEI